MRGKNLRHLLTQLVQEKKMTGRGFLSPRGVRIVLFSKPLLHLKGTCVRQHTLSFMTRDVKKHHVDTQGDKTPQQHINHWQFETITDSTIICFRSIVPCVRFFSSFLPLGLFFFLKQINFCERLFLSFFFWVTECFLIFIPLHFPPSRSSILSLTLSSTHPVSPQAFTPPCASRLNNHPALFWRPTQHSLEA